MGSIDQPSSSTTLPSEQQEILRKVENYRCTHKLFVLFLFFIGFDFSSPTKGILYGKARVISCPRGKRISLGSS